MRYTKQLITVSLLMGLSLNSCTNDDNSVPSQQTPTVILFSASPYRLESKAIHTESTMPTDLPIGIYGWGHKLGQTAPLTPRPDLTNQAYTTTDGTAYTSDMDAHFPVASDTVIDFYAYYPYQASLSNSEASYDLKDQIDIMYATPILNKGKMDVETDTNSSTATATVALTFNHQLSAITIVIKKADDIKEPLILQKVELVNYPSSIHMNIQTGRLTASNTVADYPIPLAAPITITPAEATVSTNYLLWPGEAPTFRFSISDHTYEVHPSQAFIAGKKQTQEEFFHTFNTLYESGRQIVLTSDRPPREMTQLEDRLQSRFVSGLMVDVAPPDFETRLAIIKNKAAMLGVKLPDEIYGYIAENVTANVRQIEGTLNKLLAYRDLLGDQVDEQSVGRAVRDMLQKSNEYIPSPSVIISYICKYFSVEEDVLRGQRRGRNEVNARQIAMYLIRRMTNLSLNDIGKEFGDRDHTTVLHSLDKVEKQMRTDPAFAEVVKEITTNINAKR